MKLDEYLELVSEQIRYTKIRSTVAEELKNHILDQAEAYEACGAFPEEALERAVREMGDPVETGVALDRIHRPQMNWGIVIAIGIISILSIGIFYAANILAHDIFPWQRQALFVLIGFLLMLLVYHLDYSILGKLGWKPAFTFLLFMTLGWLFFSQEIYGVKRWIHISFFSISISEAMLLYVPLFGAALYSFRGNGYGALLKILPLILLPVYFVFITPDISSAMILFICLFCMFIFAVWNNWFQIPKRTVSFISSGIVILTPMAFVGYYYFFGAEYQAARIQAFFSPSEYVQSGGYLAHLAQRMRESSAFLGSSDIALESFLTGPTTDFLTDYVLISMCSIYGIFLTVAIIMGLLFIIAKIFRISMAQKNQLGMIVGVGCGLVLFIKTAIGILINLQLLPYVSISMPFLSYGGSSTIVSYILLGLVLSVYRYKNILPKESLQKPKRHLRLKLEWETK